MRQKNECKIVRDMRKGMQVLQGKKELFWEDWLLAMICIMIGLAEGAHLGAIASGQSLLSFQKLFFCFFLIALAVFAILILVRFLSRRNRGEGKKPCSPLTTLRSVPFLFFLALLVLQLSRILFQSVIFQTQDMTLETVTSFLQTGKCLP